MNPKRHRTQSHHTTNIRETRPPQGPSSARLRQAYIDASLDLHPNLFITLTMGLDASRPEALRKALEFLKRTERRAHKKRWSEFPPERRPCAYGFMEHRETNLHYHLLVRSPLDMLPVFMDEGKAIWLGLRKSGHYYAEPIYNSAASAAYVTKELKNWITSMTCSHTAKGLLQFDKVKSRVCVAPLTAKRQGNGQQSTREEGAHRIRVFKKHTICIKLRQIDFQ